jgi:hypothetical protein
VTTPVERATGHAWSRPDDEERSYCVWGCGTYRILIGRQSHAARFSRNPSLKDGTWSAQEPSCRRTA